MMQNNQTNIIGKLSTAFSLCRDVNLQNRQTGERELQIMAMDNAYPLYLLTFLTNNANLNAEEGLRASIEFKKWVDQNWVNTNYVYY